MSIIKNMAYWKSKNALPGIEHTSDGNMPDGRSLSSPFQENGDTHLKKSWEIIRKKAARRRARRKLGLNPNAPKLRVKVYKRLGLTKPGKGMGLSNPHDPL